MTNQKHNRSPDRKSQKERIREITEQLEVGVQAVVESDNYREYLKCMSRFHNYSVNNCLLIALQRPDASLVAGYQAWKRDHGRQVKKGKYKLTVLISDPGDKNHEAAEAEAIVKIRIRK